jgi:hypothetical protein
MADELRINKINCGVNDRLPKPIPLLLMTGLKITVETIFYQGSESFWYQSSLRK